MSFPELEALTGLNYSKSLQYSAYFRAKQTRRNTSVMAPPAFKRQYFTAIPFARLSCQVLSERIEMDYAKAETVEATKYLADLVASWGGKAFVEMAHLTAMEYGRAYLVPTGTDNPDGFPGCQIVPGRDMVHREDPFTGEIVEALRIYGENREFRAHYTVDRTEYLVRKTGGWEVDVEKSVDTGGKIQVFPLMCRDEADNPWGRPEAKDIFTLQDSACRVATDLAIASATMAVPQRVLLGAEADDFFRRDATGNVQMVDDGTGTGNKIPAKQTAEELYMAKMLTIADPTAKIAEFAAAQLQNFTTALNSYTRLAAAIMGIPQSVFGVASDANPSSGDAQRQDDQRLIRRAEQLTRGFDPTWQKLFEFILESSEFGKQKVAIKWMDPSLPNLAARADAVLKLAAITVGGEPLYSWEEIRELLGDGKEVIDLARDRLETARVARLLVDTPTPVQPGANQNPSSVPQPVAA